MFSDLGVHKNFLVNYFKMQTPKLHAQGEGNGTPLQNSCLENPTDGGAW